MLLGHRASRPSAPLLPGSRRFPEPRRAVPACWYRSSRLELTRSPSPFATQLHELAGVLIGAGHDCLSVAARRYQCAHVNLVGDPPGFPYMVDRQDRG